ncbi:MAG: hypothetical protein NT045_08335, partial [Candidatus Aureabacteria bacterium]|nr:hypothetical protein [Candidatus Auribacterota bacterium]
MKWFCRVVLCGVCFLYSALCTGAEHREGDDPLDIYCINVGLSSGCGFLRQGDSTLVVSPSGKTMLIDGGRGGSCGAQAVIDTLQRVIPSGGMDYMVATHWDVDHYEGLSTVATYNGGQYLPATIFDPGDMGDDPGPTYKKVFINRRETPTVDRVIDLGGGVTATVVTVNGCILGGTCIDPGTDPNNHCIGLLIRWGGFDYITCGDLPSEWEDPLGAALVSVNRHVDVLHVSHHGANTSTSNAYLYKIQPEFGVISFGFGNNNGHPTQKVINHLNALTDAGGPYTPSYPPVTTIYFTERSEYGQAANTQILQPNPDLGGSIHINIQGDGCQYRFVNEGPNTNSFNNGPYPSDEGEPCL